MSEKSKAPAKGWGPDLIAGLATSLFNIPSGLAYAQLANVNPVYGLYAGIVSTFVAALTTGTVLMISTITSAIALATGSVLSVAGVASEHMPQALFTITFLTGVIMFVLGLARLGSIVNFVSNAVMTGFVGGTALLIILGQEQHLTGYTPVGANQFQKLIDWLQNISQWNTTSLGIGVAVIALMLLIQRIKPLKKFAAILVLLMGSIAINVLNIATPLVGSIATIPSSLPPFMLPDFALIPQLALGSVSVAFVALAQGAAVNAALPNPDGSRSSQSRDFMGQGLGNLAGSFFQSMGTGGALSQSAVGAEAGAQSRRGGVFAALWLALIVLLFGSYAEKVPLAVIGGMLVVIGAQLIVARIPSAVMVLRNKDRGAIACMGLTFISALFIPLQWTIFIGAGLSLVLYLAASSRMLRLQEAVRLENGEWEMQEAPRQLTPGRVHVIVANGLDFFAEVPALDEKMPPARGVSNAVVVLVLHDLQRITSTATLWIEKYAQMLRQHGSLLMLADIQPNVLDTLRRSGALQIIGEQNVIPATRRILQAEVTAWEAAHRWLDANSPASPDHGSSTNSVPNSNQDQ